MDSRSSPAERLPACYRAILDAVAELERLGRRPDAARIRAEATRAYSTSWDDATYRQLDRLHASAQGLLADHETIPNSGPRGPIARRSWVGRRSGADTVR